MVFNRTRALWLLDRPLLRCPQRGAVLTIRDACQHVSCMGTTGSGKTSGFGKTLAQAYLRADMGFYVLTAKPENIPLWTNYAKENGHANSLVLFDGRDGQGLNFIDYLLARFGAKGIANVIECLMRVLAAADMATGNLGAPSEVFWEHAIRKLLNYALPLLYAAHGTVSVASLIAFLVSAATDGGAVISTRPGPRDELCAGVVTVRKAADAPAIPLPKDELETLLCLLAC